MSRPVIIAIDGPAAAGKGTLARRLAAHLGYAYLDTGQIYRAVGLKLLEAGLDPADSKAALAAALSLDPLILNHPDLRTPEAGAAASKVAVIPSVRQALIAFQREFAAFPPDNAPGVVLDGRDIGTVICPDAAVKLFVTASPEARARRRFMELRQQGAALSEAEVLAELCERDARDSSRKVAPLRPARDAYLLDTTNLAIDDAFAVALAAITAKIGSGGGCGPD